MAKFDELYMDLAVRLGQQSHSCRKKVGSVIVKDGSIIAEGWNGTPSGWPNECETLVATLDGYDAHYVTKKEVLHAESNALMKVAKSTNSSVGATLYSVVSPCFECAKLIVQAGITRVVYQNNYRDLSPLDFLEQCNIQVEKLDERTIPVGGEVQTENDHRMYTQ